MILICKYCSCRLVLALHIYVIISMDIVWPSFSTSPPGEWMAFFVRLNESIGYIIKTQSNTILTVSESPVVNHLIIPNQCNLELPSISDWKPIRLNQYTPSENRYGAKIGRCLDTLCNQRMIFNVRHFTCNHIS